MDKEHLKQWRKDHGDLRQQQLADKLKVHVISLNRWENGAREIPDWLELALDGLIYRGKVPDLKTDDPSRPKKKKPSKS